MLPLFSCIQLFVTPRAIYSPPGSSAHGVFQAGILEWVAMSFSGGSSCLRDRTRVFYISCTGRCVLYHYHHLGSPSVIHTHKHIFILFNTLASYRLSQNIGSSSLCYTVGPCWLPCAIPLLASLVAQMVKNLPAVWETWVQSLGWEDLLEKGMETHSSILAWRIPWTEEPGRLLSMGLQRVGHDWANNMYYIPLLWKSNKKRSSYKIPSHRLQWLGWVLGT